MGGEGFSTMPFVTIGDCAWQREAIYKAQALYRDAAGLQAVAAIVARSHPYAHQFLAQAPVIALGLYARAGGPGVKLIKASHNLFGIRKLRDMLADLGLAQQMRLLDGRSFTTLEARLMRLISREIPPSTLAQIIPEGWSRQSDWIAALYHWKQRMERAERPGTLHLAWAAQRVSEDLSRASSLMEVADLVLHLGARFNPKWTWDKARAEAERWHAELARRENDRGHFEAFGLTFDQIIDIAPLPVFAAHGGCEIVALRSGAELHEEGRKMRHCVASYMRQVIRGTSRIYSIRQGDRRLATLEVGRAKRTWTELQLKGPCNAEAVPAARLAASLFIDEIAALPAAVIKGFSIVATEEQAA
jgi:hypothetical protein